MSVKPIKVKGGYTGFKAKFGSKKVTVRFGPAGQILARECEKRKKNLRFTGFYSPSGACAFAPSSFIEVDPKGWNGFPEVSFELSLTEFSEPAWQEIAPDSPFHFLALSVPDALILHHRGWNVPTPLEDPYPMKEGRQGIVAGKWSRNWTWAPPFGACPLPVVGLWDPKKKFYAAFDFCKARLTDHSEKYIGSSFYWESAEKNYVCLVYPYASSYIVLRYPEAPVKIASHFSLIYSKNIPSWKDPNMFYQEYIWKRFKNLLPSSPKVNDLSWFPGPMQRTEPKFDQRRTGRAPHLTYTVPEKDPWESNFFSPGTIIPTGGGIYHMRLIDNIYARNDTKAIENLKRQLAYYKAKAIKKTVGKDECVYWNKPLEGSGKPGFAGDMTTLHHIHGWGTAEVMLDIYRHEKTDEYLPFIDGTARWTKHILFSRNAISDVPEAQFTMGWSGVSFCLDYYYAFRQDKKRKKLAKLALEMARMLAYRYLLAFNADTDETDIIDGTFLIEPNSGQPWTGAPCANECCAIPVGLAMIYAATGDPILKHYLLGLLERWHLLYQDVLEPSIMDYPGKFTECWGLFEGCAVGKGNRASYGGMGGTEHLFFPLGNTKARVVAGEKAAIAFNKEGTHTNISQYRFSQSGFSFRVDSSLKGEFNIMVTCQWTDLRKMEIIVKRGKTAVKQLPDKQISEWDMYTTVVNNVRNGDIVSIVNSSSLPSSSKIYPSKLGERSRVAAIKSSSLKSRSFKEMGYQIVDLSRHCNASIDLDWYSPDSAAPYTPGERYAYGIPYFLVPASENKNKVCVRNARIPVNAKTNLLAFFVSDVSKNSKIVVNYSNSKSQLTLSNLNDHLSEQSVEVNNQSRLTVLPAFTSWPPLYKFRIDISVFEPQGKFIKSVEARNCRLFAVTLALKNADIQKPRAIIAAETKRLREEQAKLKVWQDLASQVRQDRICLLPPSSTAGRKYISNSGLLQKFKALKPADLLDGNEFNPEKHPVCVYTGSEQYLRTIKTEGDAEEAVMNYLKAGGFLVMLATGPFPFFYGGKDRDGMIVDAQTRVFTSRLGIPICGVGTVKEEIMSKFVTGFEAPPKQLFIHLNRDQQIVKGVPDKFPFPSDGNLQMRPLDINAVPKKNNAVSILALRDKDGNYFGDAASFIEFKSGEFAGSRVLYISHIISNYPVLGEQALLSLFDYLKGCI